MIATETTKLHTEQQLRDASARSLATDSEIYFLMHMNEMCNDRGVLDADTLEWKKGNKKKVRDIISSIVRHIVTTYAPDADPSNRSEVQAALGQELTDVLFAVDNDDPQFCDNYVRKAFVLFAVAMIPNFRQHVVEKSSGVGEKETYKAQCAMQGIIDAKNQMLRPGFLTKYPLHSEVVAFVHAAEASYNWNLPPE